MKIIVYHSQDCESKTLFENITTKFHAEYVAQYVEKLRCPTEQKLMLLDSVAKTILNDLNAKGGK